MTELSRAELTIAPTVSALAFAQNGSSPAPGSDERFATDARVSQRMTGRLDSPRGMSAPAAGGTPARPSKQQPRRRDRLRREAAALGPAHYDQPQTRLRVRTRISSPTSRVLLCAELAHVAARALPRCGGADRSVALAARRRAAGIQMEMLVGEQKQDGVALLLDPAGRRSLISPFRNSRKCRMFVKPAVTPLA
jgi:hypothetical protein